MWIYVVVYVVIDYEMCMLFDVIINSHKITNLREKRDKLDIKLKRWTRKIYEWDVTLWREGKCTFKRIQKYTQSKQWKCTMTIRDETFWK